MEKLPHKYKAKCKECGIKLKPKHFDDHKGKWVYICKNCCGFKYTKGDNRTIEDKYDGMVLSFIRKQFNKKLMSHSYNPKIIKKHKPNLSGKPSRNLRSYSFTTIYDMTNKKFLNKKIPSVYTIGYYFRKLHGKHNWRLPAKPNPHEPRDSFT